MEDKLMRLETELNLVKAELYKIKYDMNHPENYYITEDDVEHYMKISKIDNYSDLQHMVNFYIRRAFGRQNAL